MFDAFSQAAEPAPSLADSETESSPANAAAPSAFRGARPRLELTEEAVRCEPVSCSNPQLSGKNTGKSHERSPVISMLSMTTAGLLHSNSFP